jgi:fatty acid desaturase
MNVEVEWIRQARRVLQTEQKLFRARPGRYWLDFILSLTFAYSSATIFLLSPLGSWPQLLAYPVSVFWLYRLGSLVHEVAHLPQHEMRAFKVAWNLAVGVITLAPSPFFTRHHRDHHSQSMYGTVQDPEYIVNVFRPGSPLSIVAYCLLVTLFPLIVFLRFLLTPLTYLHPSIRHWTLVHASALTMNWRYERRLNRRDRWAITGVECLCCLRATGMLGVVVLGLSHWTRLPLLYSLALGVLMLNQLRLLADHHFGSRGLHSSFLEHIGDSCNYTGKDPITSLLFPFSIRYHALHHLFPSLPYHNLSTAHARLLERLPLQSPYRALDQISWWSVARRTLVGKMGKTPASNLADEEQALPSPSTSNTSTVLS